MIRLKSELVYFTSDTHFYHKNIIKYCDRPFSDIIDMNNKIISAWNTVVPKEATVFHLGDVCFGGIEKWRSVISQLNGNIHLIRGNHDMEHPPKDIFAGVYDQLMVIVEDDELGEQKVFMHHFPFLTWPEQAKGCWQLFGHIHSKDNVSAWSGKLQVGQYDVGMDNNYYTPVSFQEIKEIITKHYVRGSL